MIKQTLVTAIVLVTTGCGSVGTSAPAGSTPPLATATPTPASAPSSTPASSPLAVKDGEPWLVYGWARDESWYLALMRPDGADAHEIITDVPGEQKVAVWSPDGQTLAFVVRDAHSPEGSVWTANADGTGAALLSRGGVECPVGLFHPSWSPDGTKLALVCYPGGDQESIAVMDLATKSIQRLATYTPPDHLDNAPTWSPDGTLIAFDIQHFDPTGLSLDGSLVATVPAGGGEVRRLTTFDTFMAHADWSPDGHLLVMNSYDLGNINATDQPSNLYTMKPDGSDLRQLTTSSVDGSMRIGQPRWDPDGTRIVVSIASSTKPDNSITDTHLAFVDADGGEPVVISQVEAKDPDLRATP
jgi:Tol biopolymer transport system component